MATLSALPEITASPDEKSELRVLARALEAHQESSLLGPENNLIPLPEPIHQVLLQAVRFLERGEGVMIFPSTQAVTTQSAADILGVSRQYLVQLLEDGKIPFHKVGTHRRVKLKDVFEYRRQRDARRRKALDDMAKEAVADGIYDRIPPKE
jgi:excisionase family DNA binding protein